MRQKVMKPCIEKEGASDIDVSEADGHVLPSTKTGKCLRTCVFETIGVVR